MKHISSFFMSGAVMILSVSLHAGAQPKSVTDEFINTLKTHKRVVALVVNKAKVATQEQQQLVSNAVNAIIETLKTNDDYRMSKLGFIAVNLDQLPQVTQTDLQMVVGSGLQEPVTALLFENGSLISNDSLAIPIKELFENKEYIHTGVGRFITQHWGGYIEHCVLRCERADARRAFSHAKKMQVSLAQNVIDQQGFYQDNSFNNEYYIDDNGNPNYNPAQWGYESEPAYETDSGIVYSNYPYYNNSGIWPAVGLGVGLGVGAGLYNNGYYGGYRGGYRGDWGHHYHHGGYHGGGHRGGGFHGGGRGRR